MANTYQIIDEKTWERAIHCAIFRNSVEPAFCVTFEADITNFRRMVKEEGLSFTLAMVYAVCKCANHIEAFRYRFVDGQVVLYNKYCFYLFKQRHGIIQSGKCSNVG